MVNLLNINYMNGLMNKTKAHFGEGLGSVFGLVISR